MQLSQRLSIYFTVFLSAGCAGDMTPYGSQGPGMVDPDLPNPGETFDPSCIGCHGDSLSPAPPNSLDGSTERTNMAVGAHRSHLTTTESSTIHAPIVCATCHLVPQTVAAPGHMDDGNNKAEMTFSNIAIAGGATPTFNADGTCSNVYCHGSTLTGGSQTIPTWNSVGTGQVDCGSCHGAPPPPPHPIDPTCGNCHSNVSLVDNQTFLDPTLHVNGTVELAAMGGGTCDSCHGSNGNSAPPRDLAGNTDRAAVGVGAHREHLALSAWRREINCSNCHRVPAQVESPGHIDGDNIAEVPFDALNPVATISLAVGTCSNLYCHGNGRANNGTIAWTTSGPLDCNGCHQTPNPGQRANGMSGAHDEHIREENIACVECHAAVVDINATIISAPLHINGQRNILMPKGGTWNPANRSCSNMACHENESWEDDE